MQKSTAAKERWSGECKKKRAKEEEAAAAAPRERSKRIRHNVSSALARTAGIERERVQLSYIHTRVCVRTSHRKTTYIFSLSLSLVLWLLLLLAGGSRACGPRTHARKRDAERRLTLARIRFCDAQGPYYAAMCAPNFIIIGVRARLVKFNATCAPASGERLLGKNSPGCSRGSSARIPRSYPPRWCHFAFALYMYKRAAAGWLIGCRREYIAQFMRYATANARLGNSSFMQRG